jgi:hypothetical protein
MIHSGMPTRIATLPLACACAGLLVLSSACSDRRGPARSGALPTAPSSPGAPALDPFAPVGPRGAADSRLAAITFPGRNEVLEFRSNTLESLYCNNLGRPPQLTFVDREGAVVWTQEYYRYRVNGCSHPEAVARVFTQLSGGPVAPVCRDDVTDPQFPSQAESVDFRQQLEARYRDQLGKAPTTSCVDIEGETVLIQEYLRYRASGCSSADATEKVTQQALGRRGNAVPPDCSTPAAGACSYSLTPTAMTVGAGGGSFPLSVAAEPATCSWTLVSDAPWLGAAPPSGSGAASVTLNVATNIGAARTGRLTLEGADGAAALLNVSQAAAPVTPPTCTYSLTPATQAAPATGGTFEAQLNTQVGCSWQASTTVPWASVTSGTSGNTSGTIRYTIAPNTSPTSRDGRLVVSGVADAGAVTLLSQPGVPASCALTVTPASQQIPAEGGTFAVQVSTAASCTWQSSIEFPGGAIVAGATGSGVGTVRYTAPANTSPSSRSGRLTVTASDGSSRVVPLDQGVPVRCEFSVTPASQSILAPGGTFDADVLTSDGCQWTALSEVPWATIISGTTGSGAGRIRYSVASNPSGSRSGRIIITRGDLSTSIAALSLTQAPCSLTVSPLTQTLPASGGSFNINVTTEPGCTWTATTNDAWLSIPPSAPPRSGSGAVPVNASPVQVNVPRPPGTVRITGTAAFQDVTISQPNRTLTPDFTVESEPCPVFLDSDSGRGDLFTNCEFDSSPTTGSEPVTRVEWFIVSPLADIDPSSTSAIVTGVYWPCGTFPDETESLQPVRLTAFFSDGASASIEKLIRFDFQSSCFSEAFRAPARAPRRSPPPP